MLKGVILNLNSHGKRFQAPQGKIEFNEISHKTLFKNPQSMLG